MKIIYSKYLPVKGFRAINLGGVIFARSEYPVLEGRIIRHELIHTRQMLELLVVGFYVWYVVEWLIRWAICKDRMSAYRNISFEREAFTHDAERDYLLRRGRFSFARYIKQIDKNED